MLNKLFRLKENNTTVKNEIIAGITTFMTMAYILAVNPSILADAGMDPTAVLLATAIASFIGSTAMALMANLPFVLSAGMGLNAFFAYTVVLGFGYPWQVALLAVFVEGLIFIVHSVCTQTGGFRRDRSVHRLHRSPERRSFRRQCLHTRFHHQLHGKLHNLRYLCHSRDRRHVPDRDPLHQAGQGLHPDRYPRNVDPRHPLPVYRNLYPHLRSRLLLPSSRV